MPSHSKTLHWIIKHQTLKIEDYRHIIEYFIGHPVTDPKEVLIRIDLVEDTIAFVRSSQPSLYRVSKFHCFKQQVETTQQLFLPTISNFLHTL